MELIEEFRAPANSKLIPDQTYTPVNTFNGVTYVVWVSPDLYPMVAKIDGKKTTTERLDDNDDYKVLHNGHHKFSMGIVHILTDDFGWQDPEPPTHEFPVHCSAHNPLFYSDLRSVFCVRMRITSAGE